MGSGRILFCFFNNTTVFVDIYLKLDSKGAMFLLESLLLALKFFNQHLWRADLCCLV